MDFWWLVYVFIAMLIPAALLGTQYISNWWIRKNTTPLFDLLRCLHTDPTADTFLKAFHRDCFTKQQKGIVRAFARSIVKDFGTLKMADIETCKLNAYRSGKYGAMVTCKMTAQFTLNDTEVRFVNIDASWTKDKGTICNFVLTPADEKPALDLAKYVTVAEIEPYAEDAVNALLTAPGKAMALYFHESLRAKFTPETLDAQVGSLREKAGGWKSRDGDVDTVVNGVDYKDGVVVVSALSLGVQRDIVTKLKIVFLGLQPIVLGFEVAGSELKQKIHFVEQ